MPRIFWTPKRKAQLLKDSASMTTKEMARKHMQPTSEIERMLAHLQPGKKLIMRTYKESGKKVTVYYPGYAFGVTSQRTGAHHHAY